MFPFRSFFVSLFFGNLLLMGVILGTGFWVIHSQVNRRTTHLTEQLQEQLLLTVQGEFQESWPHISTQRIERYWQHHPQKANFRLTVIDAEGRVLGDSEIPAVNMEPHLPTDRPEITAAMEGSIGADVRRSRSTNVEYRYLAAPVVKEGTIVAVVRLAFPAALFQKNHRMVSGSVQWVSLFMLLAVVFLVPLLLRWIWNRPLRLLHEEAGRIAEGNLEPAPPVEAPLEMVPLFQSLEVMRRTVSEQLATITRQREGLQTILQHHPDAIFAMNRAAEVIYCNAAAKNLFHFAEVPEHSFLQTIVRNAVIIDWYLQCRKTAPPHTVERKEVVLFGRKHFLELEFVETKAEVKEDAACVVIVSDLTESVRANQMKTDFVANASHELRTPLAAIRAALDNVSDDIYGDKETLERILQIVNRHVSRLDALLEDLLALQGVEDETAAVRLEETNVAEQQSWIEELFRVRIEEKQLAFSIASELGAKPFQVDNKRLGLILQNLIDNAIKFTPSGGQISLNFRREEEFLLFECRDNGFGIAVNEQRRVFERFYQGDSSKTGDGRIRGTGLGLAIVKHAVERLKGTITLDSRIAQGSLFTVRIPVVY